MQESRTRNRIEESQRWKRAKWARITSGANQSRSRNQNCDEYVHMNVCQYELLYIHMYVVHAI